MAHTKYSYASRAVRGSTINQRRRLNSPYPRAFSIRRGGRGNGRNPHGLGRRPPGSTYSHTGPPFGGFNFGGGRKRKRIGLRSPGVNIKKVKAVKFKGGRKVAVSKPLRAKINKVMNGRSYNGYYQHTTYQFVNVDGGGVSSSNTQTTFPTYYEGVQHELFTPQLVLNAASILWNGKSPTYPVQPTVQDTRNFNQFETKVEVKKIWSCATMTNNTQRKMYVKMYDCKAKNMVSGNYPLGQWIAALSEMYNSKGVGAQGLSENPLNTLTTTLHANPKSIIQFNQFYSAECTTIVLAPGQTYEYRIKGPSQVSMDMSKYYNGTQYQIVNKFGRYVFGVAYLDLVTMDNTTPVGGIAARAGESSLRSGLDIEYNTYYCLTIPEKAGIVGAGAVNTGLELGERHNAYSIQNDEVSLVGKVPYRVDEADPNPAEAPPDA